MYVRLIVFTLLLLMIVFYFEKILGFFQTILTICFPFLIGAGLAFVYNIIANNIIRIFKIQDTKPRRFFVNLLSILIVFSIFAIFLCIVLPKILFSMQSLISNFPTLIEEFYQWLLYISKDVEFVHNILIKFDVNELSTSAIDNVAHKVTSWIVSGGVNNVVGSLYTFISTTFSFVLTAFIAIVFSVILLFNKVHIKREIISLLKAYLPKKIYINTTHILKLIIRIFTSYVGGTCTECLILGTLVTIGSLILNIPYSFLVGLTVAIGALVPMFGALFAAILCTFFIAITSPMHGLYFIIMFICIQQVEGNFIYPHVVGRSVGFPAMYVIVAVTIGANLGGIIGMIVFIPVCSCIYQLVQEDVMIRLQTTKEVSDE